MLIKSISGANIKGRTFNHDLGALNLITGPNKRGKSAIADACRLVLLGYLPELGKTNADTFRLCSADKMEVGAKIDVTAHKFSGSAREAITAAGGSATEL